MILIPPVPVTDARLSSSNLPEADKPAWSAATAYAVGAQVMHNHRIWEALAAHTNITPSANVPDTWLDLRPTNRWAMFDDEVATQSVSSGNLVVTLAPNTPFNAISFFNVFGKRVDITMTEPAPGGGQRTVGTRTAQLQSTLDIASWWDFFFTATANRSDAVLLELPTVAAGTVTITIVGHPASVAGGPGAKCGLLVMGRSVLAGATLYGVSLGIIDFSRKERDEFGRIIRVERGYSDRMELDVVVEKERFSRLRRLLASLRAKGCVYIGDSTEDATILYGWYKDFDMIIAGQEDYTLSISLEGFL